MGIKRSASGRIYFDAPDENEENQSYEAERPAVVPEQDRAQDREQDRKTRILNERRQQELRHTQLLKLLAQVSDRLKRSESEREILARDIQDYRNQVIDIEDAGKNAEAARIALEKKLSDRLAELDKREIVRAKTSKDLDNKYKTLIEQAEARAAREEKRREDLDKRLEEAHIQSGLLENKLEEAVAEQTRLSKLIEKNTQDRSRLLRRIERVEEGLLETRDTLKSRAMVLLTDQALAGQSRFPQIEAWPEDENGNKIAPSPEALAAANGELSDTQTRRLPVWARPMRVQAAGFAGMLTAALLTGWVMGDLTRPAYTPVAIMDRTMLTGLQEEIPATPEAAAPPVSSNSLTAEDLLSGEKDAQAVEAFAADPQALAATLNEIEPQVAPAAPAPEPVQTEKKPVQMARTEPTRPIIEPPPAPKAQTAAKPKTAEKPEISAAPPEPARESALPPAKTAAPPLPAPRDPATLIKPDSSLPPLVKDIETRAFEGVAEAQHDLAAIYTAGHGDVARNYERAAFWFRQAAVNGIANAQYNLGVLYHQGLGVDQDLKEAIKWYRAAAERGHPEAHYNLGIAHIEGIGVTYDPKRAAAYFETAAAGGITEAAYNLGLIYENGLLGAPSPEKALFWYKTAADQGNPEAKTALEQLSKTLNISPGDIDRLMKESRSDFPAVPEKPKYAHNDVQKTHISPPNAPGNPIRDQALVSQIQNELIDLGLYPGPADGVFDPLTEDAIRSYQKTNGIPTTGTATGPLLAHMRGE